MQLPFRTFVNKTSYQTILSLAVMLMGSMFLQLKFSNRARQWIKSLIHGLALGGSFFGLLLCLAFMIIKKRLSKKEKKLDILSGYEEDVSSG